MIKNSGPALISKTYRRFYDLAVCSPVREMSESLKYILHTVWLQLEENLGLPEPCNFYQTKNILSYFFPYPLVKHRNLPFIFHFYYYFIYFFICLQFFFFFTSSHISSAKRNQILVSLRRK